MNILIIGKGGREHALADAASRSERVEQVFVAPGSYGMQDVATIVDIAADDFAGLVAFAKQQAIDLTIVGPEDILALGIVDYFNKAGLRIFGPTKAAAQLESSKDFAKRLMHQYGIPTATYQTFDNYDDAYAYMKAVGVPIVIKEDGLKAGKGVTVAYEEAEAMDALAVAFAIEGNRVVIEACLEGFEFSLMTFVCDDLVIPMEVAQDHKCAYDGDCGPNTGGMGVYSPVKKITPEIVEEAMETIMKPMAKAMVKEGVPFVGFLYGGLMLTADGIQTIEFNARFGDPEAEVILPRLESDFIEVIEAVMNHQEPQLKWKDTVTLGVVLASEHYPASATKGAIIEGLDQVDASVFHMGTAYRDGQYVSDGGRVLIVVAEAKTIEQAYEKAYTEVRKIKCDKLFYRKDIGKKDMGGSSC